MTTIEYMDAIKARYGLTSDYQLFKLMGCTQQAVSKWRSGKATIGDELSGRVAELLEIDPAKVLADLYAERVRDETMKALWRRIAATFACTAAITIGSVVLPQQSSATEYKFSTKRRKLDAAHA